MFWHLSILMATVAGSPSLVKWVNHCHHQEHHSYINISNYRSNKQKQLLSDPSLMHFKCTTANLKCVRIELLADQFILVYLEPQHITNTIFLKFILNFSIKQQNQGFELIFTGINSNYIAESITCAVWLRQSCDMSARVMSARLGRTVAHTNTHTQQQPGSQQRNASELRLYRATMSSASLEYSWASGQQGHTCTHMRSLSQTLTQSLKYTSNHLNNNKQSCSFISDFSKRQNKAKRKQETRTTTLNLQLSNI